MIFRAFFGKMVPEAEELAHGHLYHAPEPINPATGEVEDTEVGFPGPDHHIAEREVPMKVAMGSLAVLAIIGGVLQIPGVTHSCTTFLEPTFADSQLYASSSPRRRRSGRPDDRRACSASPASCSPTLWGQRPAAGRAAPELAALHRSSSTSGTSTSSIDFMFVRPFAWFGRFANSTFERVFVNGALVGGTTGVVRACPPRSAAIQSGYLRYYAALLLVGLTGARRLLPDLRHDHPLSPSLSSSRLPARPARRAAAARASRGASLAGTLVPLVLRGR